MEYQDGSKPGVARLVAPLDPNSIGFASGLDWKIGTIFKEGDLLFAEQRLHLIVPIKREVPRVYSHHKRRIEVAVFPGFLLYRTLNGS